MVLGISKDIKEIKSKMREYVEDNEQYPYFYKLVGDEVVCQGLKQ